MQLGNIRLHEEVIGQITMQRSQQEVEISEGKARPDYRQEIETTLSSPNINPVDLAALACAWAEQQQAQ